jgi:dethiobiotin synthetase
MTPPLPGIFVVGTDTGVGKTFVASSLARSWQSAGHRVGILKPVASGATFAEGRLASEDTIQLIEAIGGGVALDRVTPIVFEEPLAPPVAARRLGQPLLMSEVESAVIEALAWWSDRADVMIVEGVGGLLCPIAEGATVADLAILLDYPVLIVAHRGLGTLNHTLLTVEAARSRGLRVAGVILNGPRPSTDPIAEATNAGELAIRLGGVAILADWPHQVDFGNASVAPEAAGWYDLVQTPRRSTGYSGLLVTPIADSPSLA